MDPLSQVLQLMSLRGCVYFSADFRAPWGMTIPTSPVAQFHLVQQGTCRVRQAGTEQVLSTGDVAVFPHGGAHLLYDGSPPHFMNGKDVVWAVTSGRDVFADGPHVTARILCGHFEIERSSRHPLLFALPECMIIRGFDQGSKGWSSRLTELLLHEQALGLVGSAEIVVRLAESLFIQVLRTYMDNDEPVNFLAALNDPRLHQALEIIHAASSTGLTLENLARRVGMSRSSLAKHFKSAVGLSPMKYYSSWQLMRAQKLLQSTNSPISLIAETCGYNSEAAFSRAFKTYIGVSPSTVRRQMLAIASK